MKCSIPASLASSTTCWISGLSTMVSISFGIALVAGRTRVPRPATGKTALRIFMGLSRCLLGEHAEGAFDGFGNRFAAGNKDGCVVTRGIVKRTGTRAHPCLFPPPLWGRVRERGKPQTPEFAIPPLQLSPTRGREPTSPVAALAFLS